MIDEAAGSALLNFLTLAAMLDPAHLTRAEP